MNNPILLVCKTTPVWLRYVQPLDRTVVSQEDESTALAMAQEVLRSFEEDFASRCHGMRRVSAEIHPEGSGRDGTFTRKNREFTVLQDFLSRRVWVEVSEVMVAWFIYWKFCVTYKIIWCLPPF